MSRGPKQGDGDASGEDNVIRGVFKGAPLPSEAKLVDQRCRHRSYFVHESERQVTCQGCDAKLDAFEVLMAYANHERNWQLWNKRCLEKRAELRELEAEERRIKQRMRNASRKDAKLAVAEERKKTVELRRRIAFNARELGRLAGRIQRAAEGKAEGDLQTLPTQDEERG